jgi:hypothetical protein
MKALRSAYNLMASVPAAFKQFRIMSLHSLVPLSTQLQQWVTQQGRLIHLSGFGHNQYLGLQAQIAKMLPSRMKPQAGPIVTTILIALALAQAILDNLGVNQTAGDGLNFVLAQLTPAKDPGAQLVATLNGFASDGNRALLTTGGDVWDDVANFLQLGPLGL